MKKLVLILILSCPVFGQKLSVQIEIVGNKPLNTELRSYVARGLRSLGDVEVVEKKGTFLLMLTPFDDDRIGYDVTFQLLKPTRCGDKVYMDLLIAGLQSGEGSEMKRVSDLIVVSVDDALNDHRKR